MIQSPKSIVVFRTMLIMSIWHADRLSSCRQFWYCFKGTIFSNLYLQSVSWCAAKEIHLSCTRWAEQGILYQALHSLARQRKRGWPTAHHRQLKGLQLDSTLQHRMSFARSHMEAACFGNTCVLLPKLMLAFTINFAEVPISEDDSWLRDNTGWCREKCSSNSCSDLVHLYFSCWGEIFISAWQQLLTNAVNAEKLSICT